MPRKAKKAEATSLDDNQEGNISRSFGDAALNPVSVVPSADPIVPPAREEPEEEEPSTEERFRENLAKFTADADREAESQRTVLDSSSSPFASPVAPKSARKWHREKSASNTVPDGVREGLETELNMTKYKLESASEAELQAKEAGERALKKLEKEQGKVAELEASLKKSHEATAELRRQLIDLDDPNKELRDERAKNQVLHKRVNELEARTFDDVFRSLCSLA